MVSQTTKGCLRVANCNSSVLDSSLGKPAKGVEIGLLKYRTIAAPENPGDPEVFAFDPIAHGYESLYLIHSSFSIIIYGSSE